MLAVKKSLKVHQERRKEGDAPLGILWVEGVFSGFNTTTSLWNKSSLINAQIEHFLFPKILLLFIVCETCFSLKGRVFDFSLHDKNKTRHIFRLHQ